MIYLDSPCTRCRESCVVPPRKADLSKARILVRCANCKKYSRYNIVYHTDGTQGYYLSKWGRGEPGVVLILQKRRIQNYHTKLSDAQIRHALDVVYGKGK